jgi:5-methylcytosine-specific restriction protein A
VHAQAVEHARPNVTLRRLYRTVRWFRLRAIVLQEEPTCIECEQEGFIRASHDVHHQQKATFENFFDRSNLQALCVMHHSRHTQRGE